MEHKRITLFAGHYGSGKTNIAVNYTLALKRQRDMVMLADLDIVNPYYRAKDSARELEEKGIRVISSFFANSNVDLPALPQDIYAITDDRDIYELEANMSARRIRACILQMIPGDVTDAAVAACRKTASS